jgi:hypothetical protein
MLQDILTKIINTDFIESKKTKSNNDLYLTYATFEKACHLKDTLAFELSKANLLKDISLSQDISQLVTILPNIILILDSSKPVKEALFKCLEKCTLNDQKINVNLFNDNPSYISDYYEIVLDCLRINLSPFFKNQALLLLTKVTPGQETNQE